MQIPEPVLAQHRQLLAEEVLRLTGHHHEHHFELGLTSMSFKQLIKLRQLLLEVERKVSASQEPCKLPWWGWTIAVVSGLLVAYGALWAGASFANDLQAFLPHIGG